jgi:predicted dehydrogenase
MTKLALRAGIPVLVEKPLSISMEGVEELKALATSLEVPVMVGFNRRCWEPVRHLRAMISNRHPTSKLLAQMMMTSDVKAWSSISEIGDLLDDLGSHQLDLLRYIFDSEICSVSAYKIDPHAIQMKVKLGGTIVADCMIAHRALSLESIEVQCGRERYEIHMGSDRIRPAKGLMRSMLDHLGLFQRQIRGRKSTLRSSYEQQLVAFFDHVHTRTIPKPGITDGIAAIRGVEAARHSIANGGMEVMI